MLVGEQEFHSCGRYAIALTKIGHPVQRFFWPVYCVNLYFTSCSVIIMKTYISFWLVSTVISSSTAALTSSARTLSPTLQPVQTSKVPQLSTNSYLSSSHFHTVYTVLPSSPQYKPTESPMPPDFTTIPTSSANSEHTTGYQTTPVSMYTPSVTPMPTKPQPIAGMLHSKMLMVGTRNS